MPKYPTRGEGLDILKSPLTVPPMKGDVTPPVNNNVGSYKDPLGFVPKDALEQPKKIARIK